MATDVSGMSREKKLAILTKGVHAARAERESQGQMPDPRQKIPVAQSAGSVTYRVNEPLSALTSRIVAATQRQAQRKKQNTMESRLDDALPSRSEDSVKQAADDAQRRLQDYTHSPAVQKRMRQQDEADTMANDAWDDPNQPQRDETLDRLQQEAKQAQADYDDAQRKEADQNVYDKDMADISALSEEEQQQLADYVSVRDQGTTGNPITDLIYLPIRKKRAAGGLLEKFGETRLNELAETYARDLHKQTKQEVQAAAQKNAQGVGKAALSTVGNIVASPIGSIMGVKGRLDEMGNSTGRYSTLETYTPGDAINVYGDAAKQAVTKQIEGENPNFFRQSAAILYQAGTGALESAAKAITLGPAAAASTSAMGQYTRTLSEASERGATAQQAALLASANAALDYAMDKIPLDRLFSLAKSGSTSALKAALKQAGIEASTEGASFIGSQLLDMAILQQNSEYAQSIQNYMTQRIQDYAAQGITQLDDAQLEAIRQEATTQANKDLLSQAGQQAIIGGISGGVSAGVSTAIGNARTRRAEKAANAAMQDANADKTEANAPLQQPAPQQPEPTPQEPPAPEQPIQPQQPIQQPEPTQTAPESPLDTVSRMVRESTARRQQEQQAARQSIQDQVAAMTGKAPDPGDVDQLDTFGQHTRQDVADPMQDRPYSEASKRSTKAYMYDNPEVKPYFQEQAAWLLNELQDTTRGEKSFNADAYYRTGGEGGITGTSRHTSDSTAELLDQDGLSYDQIERGLYAILNDNGAENNAASKKIEYVINDRLMNGYTDFYSGEHIGSDENYLNLLKQQQATDSVGESASNAFQHPVSDFKLAKTGESITVEGFHGEGKSKGEIYAHAQVPVAGEGRYFAPTEKGARNYGDRVSRETVHFDRPFVIQDDSDWSNLVDSVGLKYRTPAYLSEAEAKQYTQSIRDYLTGNGYDGLIVNYESAKQGDRNTATGGWARAIDNVFGGDQYVKYNTDAPEPSSLKASPSIGAADQNFTGTARYQELLSDDNVKPARRDDFRDDEVPEMDGSKRVSNVAKNLMGSKNTTDAGADQIKQIIDSGIFSYDKKSNKQSLQEAYDDLNARGADAVRTEINRHLKDGVIADGDIEKAVTLANQYIQSGDNEAAKDVISDLSLLAQKSGRNLQLFSLIRRMTPEGQLDVIQSAADKMLSGGKQPKQSKSGKSGTGGDSAPKITADIPVELKNKYLEAARSKDPQRIDEATRAIAQVVGSQYKATWKEKWDAWRYMCMLGNFSTNERNIAGNAMMKPYAAIKDELAAAFELALPKNKRTKSLYTDKNLLEWAKEDTKSIDAQNALKYSAKMGADVTQDIFSENKRIFKSGALEKVRNLTEWAPSAGDMLFKNGYYAKYLANFLTARGVSAEDVRAGKVDPDLMSQARQYAVDNAYINTFNDRNNFSDAIASVGKWKASTNPATRAFGTAIDGVLPFRRTPANILVRFKEYSPVEFLSAGIKLARKQITGADFCNSLATGLTGSGAMVLGAALASGIYTKSGDGVRLITKATDEEKLQGKQDYSIEVTLNGKTYSATVDWAAPANLPLFVGVNVHNAREKSKESKDWVDTLVNFADASKDVLEPMLALSCLSSVNDLLESVKYADDASKIYTIAASTATSYLTQGIPSLLRQTATFTQTEKQTTFANDDRKLVRGVQRSVSNIPFVGDKLGLKTDKIDVWGQKVSTGNIGQRAFNAYLNPSKISQVKSDATTAELDRLSKTEYGTGVAPELAPKTMTYTDKQGLTHKDVRLTASQWETYATTRGQTSKTVLDRLVKSSDYAKLGDAGKAAVIDLVYKYADKTGAIKAMSDHDGYPETWMQEAFDSKNPGKYIIQKVNNQQMKTAMDNLTKAWAHKTDRPAAKQDLETAYDTYSKSSADVQKAVMEAAEGTVKKYMEGRAQGMKSDTMLSILKQVQSIPEKNRQKAAYQYQAITSTKGLSESQVDTAMKLYMKDGRSTELKYDYIRQEMGYSAQDYATIQKAYSTADANFGDGNGKVKKNEALAALEDIGYSPAEAANIYNLLWGNTGKMKESLAKFEESRQ